MDAVKFLKEHARMCKFYKGCEGCPFKELPGDNTCTRANYECQIKVVEEWSKEHPVKTRMSEFLKLFPTAPIQGDGMPITSPCNLEQSYYEKQCDVDCGTCREKYWLEEIDEND